MPTDVSKYEQQLKALDERRKKMAALMKKAKIKEEREKFNNAGKELFDIYQNDPLCKDSSKIVAICKKYFLIQTTDDQSIEEKENTGMDIASKTKK
jgi:hypothetical protein